MLLGKETRDISMAAIDSTPWEERSISLYQPPRPLTNDLSDSSCGMGTEESNALIPHETNNAIIPRLILGSNEEPVCLPCDNISGCSRLFERTTWHSTCPFCLHEILVSLGQYKAFKDEDEEMSDYIAEEEDDGEGDAMAVEDDESADDLWSVDEMVIDEFEENDADDLDVDL